MITRLTIAAMLAATALVTATGCAVERHQETVGAYVDDSAVTTKVKAKFAEDPTVSAMLDRGVMMTSSPDRHEGLLLG